MNGSGAVKKQLLALIQVRGRVTAGGVLIM